MNQVIIKRDLAFTYINQPNLELLRVDFSATSDAPGDDQFVFRVRGTKGKGSVRATCVTLSPEELGVTDGTLTMDDGAEYDLFPEEP